MVALSENGRPGVTQEQKGFNVEIKAPLFKTSGIILFCRPLPLSHLHPSFLLRSIFPFQRLVSGSDRGSVCVLNSDQSVEGGKLF